MKYCGGEPKVSVNILNYNTFEKAKVCIESCLTQTDVNFDVFLIDNLSTDDSLNKLKECFGERIYYIENKNNYGYAKGNNIGVRYCYQQGYKYSLILNSDTKLSSPSVLTSLVRVIESCPNCAVVAPAIYNVTSNGWILNKNDSSYLKMLRLFRILPHNKRYSDNCIEVSECHGSALLVDCGMFLEVEGFPEHYFMYGEEGTFSKKVLWGGKKLIWCVLPDHYVLHFHDTAKKGEDWRTILMGRNHFLEFCQNKKEHHPVLWSIVFMFECLIRFVKGNRIYLSGCKHALDLLRQMCNDQALYTDGKAIKDKKY